MKIGISVCIFGFSLTCAVVFLGSPLAAQESFIDEFNAPELDRTKWCPCQIDMETAPVLFLPDPDDPNDRFSRITVDPSSLGGNNCDRDNECKAPEPAASQPEVLMRADTPEALGPSFVKEPDLFAMTVSRSNPYCTEQEHECIQRQELRFQKAFHQPADRPFVYSFRFRMPDPVTNTTHSIRWVTAQWKQEPVSKKYKKELGKDWGPSPFLAQRFDNGVLYITVQDEHCRCRVASAPDGSDMRWEAGVPKDCQDEAGKACTPQLRVEYGPDPILSSPQKRWVEMSYRVEAGRARPAVIEAYQDNRFIVRVTGMIGYEPEPNEKSEVKFKIGHYRDYMPSVDTMDIDWIKVEAMKQ